MIGFMQRLPGWIISAAPDLPRDTVPGWVYALALGLLLLGMATAFVGFPTGMRHGRKGNAKVFFAGAVMALLGVAVLYKIVIL